MNKFIFDVDGTLTPSRGKMDLQFQKWFNDFCKTNPVYLVTGSDKPKTIEQIGEETYNLAHTVYNCSGSDVWQGKKNIKSNDWVLPLYVKAWLIEKLEDSRFPLRTGLHIEQRKGMINYSIVGRNATLGERKLYVKYDKEHNERNLIAELFNREFEDLIARPGGETGIDISPKGSDKSQILVDFNHEEKIYFFGDRMDPAGNDYPLKKALYDDFYNHDSIEVEGWQDTWEKLKCI